MVYVARPLRWFLATAWRYATPIILALSAFGAFRSQDDVQGITYLLLMTGYVFLLAAASADRSSFNRKLAIPAYISIALGLLIGFGQDNRHVAPVLNQVLPHAQLEVKQSWAISRGDKAAAQNGVTSRLFEVTLASRWARGVGVDVYDFKFESDGATYDNTFVPEYRGCDQQTVLRNGSLTCLIALEVSQSATSGTLVFSSDTYKAWANVSF